MFHFYDYEKLSILVKTYLKTAQTILPTHEFPNSLPIEQLLCIHLQKVLINHQLNREWK